MEVADTNSFSPASDSAAPAAAVARTRARRPFIVLALIAALVLCALGGYALVTAGEETTDNAQIVADIVPIAPNVAGKVARVAVKENQRVKKGDLIAQIDQDEYAVRVKQAEADRAIALAQAQAADAQIHVVEASSQGGLNSARAAVMGSLAGVRSAAAQVNAARANIQSAQADLRKAELDLDRTGRLKAASVVSQQEADNAQTAYDGASAEKKQAEANLAAAEEVERVSETQVNEARGRLNQSSPIEALIAAARAQADTAHARVQMAEAQLEQARLLLSYTTVVAPSDGVVSNLTAHDGQFLSVGQPVIQLVPAGSHLIANFKETQVSKMKPGQRATIRLDTYRGRTFEGTVESLSGGTGSSFALLPPDNASGNFVKVVQRVMVRIAWQPPADIDIRAGLSADVTVDVGW